MTWIIVGREYRERVRSRAFVLATIFTVVLFGVVILLPQVLGGDDGPSPVGYLPDGERTALAAERLAEVQYAEASEDDPAAIRPIEIMPITDRTSGEAALRSGEIDALLLDDTTVLVENQNLFGSGGVPGVVRQAARVVELGDVVAEAGISEAEVEAVLGAGLIEVETLDVEVDESRTLVAYAGIMLTYVALLLYGTWTLLGVTEEKSSRVVEIILSTTRPASLLGGKVIGIGLVALTQLAIVFVVIGGMLYLLGGGSPDVGEATGGAFDVSIADVSVAQAGILLLWFVIGFSIYNVLFAAIGSLVSRVEDAQSANIPLSLSVVGSLFLSFAALGDPNGIPAVVGTFIPFSAPFVVPVRFALEGIAPWEVVASIVVSVVAFAVFIRIAGRIYEGAILRTGERVKIRDAWRGDR